MSLPMRNLGHVDIHGESEQAPGIVVKRRVTLHQEKPRVDVPYLVRAPASGFPVLGTLVVVHGISRNTEEHVAALGALADELNLNVIAPWFKRKHFNGYQRLVCETGQRADLALLQVIADAEFLLGPIRGIHLFGFSGGAQFAHRFALCHPERVRSLFLAAAGHYTFPSPSQHFPYGLKQRRPYCGLQLHLEQLLRLPMTVVVGDQDRQRDPSLRVTPKLDREQGRDRLERGRRYVMATNVIAGALGIPLPSRFASLGGAGHDFGSCVQAGIVRRLREHLLRTATWPPEGL